MSIHRSLRLKSAMLKHRNVLTRTERLDRLEEAGRWNPKKDSVLGLPKVRSIKVIMKKKKKDDDEE